MKKTYVLWYFIAFLIPFLACTIMYAVGGVYPFGQECILHVDMYHQYCPFFTEFANKLQNGESLLFTWKEGVGSDFLALYAYYLASPLNWLLVFWPKQYVIEFMTLTILVKIALAGCFMFVYLDWHFALKKSTGELRFLALVFSTAYALSGFVAAYSWDIMWMDTVCLAPLIIVGLERLVKEQKVVLYYASLSIAILANYYMGMIVCIFLVLWFVLLLLETKRNKIRTICRFVWYSFLAGGTGAILLIPEAIILGYSGSAGFRFPKQMEWYFDIISELSRGLTAASVYTGAEHWPNLYAGAFSFLLVLLYIVNGRISWKQKLPRLLLVAFFLVSFSNNYLDFFWHGLHFPDSLPGRQSFLYVFVILELGFTVLTRWDGVGYVKIAWTTIAVMAFLALGFRTTDASVTEEFAFLMTGLFVVCYVILMLLSKLAGAKDLCMVKACACGLAIAELVINMAITGFYTTSRTSYTRKVADYEVLLEEAKAREDGKQFFYRVEDPQRMTKNDSALYGYPSVTEFSSLMNIHTSHFYQSVYMEGGKNFYCYNGATPLTSAMLSVKYVLLDNGMEDGALRTCVAQSNGQYLYENNYWLPLGFMIPEQMADAWDNSNSSDIMNLNSLAKSLGAKEQMLSSYLCGQEQQEGSTTLTFADDGIYYAAYEKCSADTLTATFSTGRKRKFSKTTHRYLLELGECMAGDTVVISNNKNEQIQFKVYQLNLGAVETAYETLAKDTLCIESFSDTYIAGTVDVTEEGRLVLSVPIQKGWTIRVDKRVTEPTAWKEAWMSIPLQEGHHEITLSYCTPGIKEGAALSIGSVTMFVVSVLIGRRKKA